VLVCFHIHVERVQSVLRLLRSIESISSCRDRNKLLSELPDTLKVLFGKQAKAGIFLRSHDLYEQRDHPGDDGLTFHLGTGNDGVPGALWNELARKVQRDRDSSLALASADGWHCGALALESSELWADEFILVFATKRSLEAKDTDALESLVRMFGNQIRLLDYSELDSLTHLLNRKTFDETFDRLLIQIAKSSQESSPLDGGERRSCKEEDPAWLATIDIDHFKRINDSYGHLFGDEVLLRMGGLLRKTFRDCDRLFRFGGEEFVVIINAPGRELAETGFERFRSSLETHEFPQVGTVTCSIGFTLISKNDVSSNVLGHSDQALYFAKNNGRNQTCCFEQLMEQGVIASIASSEEIDQNIEELFG
jgi:diguanylate cyclase (GGDEF)-like protein